MKMKIILLYVILLCSSCLLGLRAQETKPKELEVISIHALANYPDRFDFSGIVKTESGYLAIADKVWNQYAYHIEIDSNYWYLTDSVQLGLDNHSDLEGIDFCDEAGLYFIDEKFNRAYLFDGSGNSEIVFNKGILRDGLKWGTNSGLEGVAVDCERNVLYLAKERDPGFIVTYDLENHSVLDIFNLPDSNGDVSDLKFENGFLYLLERSENYVTKINVLTKQIVEKVSYKDVCSHPDGKLYSHTKYGLAEALLLTEDEIWIGLDNNGLPFSSHARQAYQLTGNQPVLIKFKRPENF